MKAGKCRDSEKTQRESRNESASLEDSSMILRPLLGKSQGLEIEVRIGVGWCINVLIQMAQVSSRLRLVDWPAP